MFFKKNSFAVVLAGYKYHFHMWQVCSVVACPMCFRVVLSKVIKLYRHRPSVAASPPPSLLAQLVFEMTYCSNIVHQMHFALFYRLLVAAGQQRRRGKIVDEPGQCEKNHIPLVIFQTEIYPHIVWKFGVSKNRRVRDKLKQVISKLKKVYSTYRQTDMYCFSR